MVWFFRPLDFLCIGVTSRRLPGVIVFGIFFFFLKQELFQGGVLLLPLVPQLLVSLLPRIQDAILKERVWGVRTLGSSRAKVKRKWLKRNF